MLLRLTLLRQRFGERTGGTMAVVPASLTRNTSGPKRRLGIRAAPRGRTPQSLL